MPQSRTAPDWAGYGWASGATLAGAALVRGLRPERSTIDIAVTAATPWLLAPSCVLLGGALLHRRRALAILASGLATYYLRCVRPWPKPSAEVGHDGDGPELKVSFANVLRLNTDIAGILGELATGDHDIVALAEVTERHLRAIDAVLPPSTYRWRTIEPDGVIGSKGLALVSRVPIEGVQRWWSQGHPQLDGMVLVPGAAPVHLLVVHTWGPLGRPKIDKWRAQHLDIAARTKNEPTVIVGDFNATRQHRSFDSPGRDQVERRRYLCFWRLAGDMAGEPAMAPGNAQDRPHPGRAGGLCPLGAGVARLGERPPAGERRPQAPRRPEGLMPPAGLT